MQEKALIQEIGELINKHSRENMSNTPDFILGKFLHGCLEQFENAVINREFWYGRKTKPAETEEPLFFSTGNEHALKTWMPQFQNILDERKLFEYRINDRGFQLGDFLLLREWNQDAEKYTGRRLLVKVIYIVEGGIFGIPKEYCIMSIVKVK